MENQPTIYTIKSTLRHYKGPRVIRVMEIAGATMLHKLSYEILNSFGFALDHAYGFFSNIQNKNNSDEVYDHFLDDPNCRSSGTSKEGRTICKGTVNVSISEVFEPKKRMLFFFDYGDEWEFLIRCEGVKPAIPGTVYPRIIKERGQAPKQYPESDEEEEIMRRRGLM